MVRRRSSRPFVIGIALQLPFGALAYLAARFLLRTARRLGRRLASRARRRGSGRAPAPALVPGGAAAAAASLASLAPPRPARASAPRRHLIRVRRRIARRRSLVLRKERGMNRTSRLAVLACAADRWAGRCGRARRHTPDEPVDLARERATAVQPRDPDREGERGHDEDRAHPAEGLLDRLVRAEPGWKRVEQSTGSGENAVVTQVTWTGGHVPTEEDSLFQFLAQPSAAGDLHLPRAADVLGRLDRQLVRAGVLGRAGADDRRRELGRRRYIDLTIVALVLGAPRPARGRHRALLAGRPGADVTARRAWSRRRRGRCAGVARAGGGVRARVLDQDRPCCERDPEQARRRSVQLTYDEAVEPRFAIISVTDVRANQETTGR